MMFTFDILERDSSGRLVKTGTKDFGPAAKPLNKWVKRPKGTVIRPPMNGALRDTISGKISCDAVAPGAFGYLRADANDVYNQQRTVLTSGPNIHGHGWSITPANFEQSMLVFAIRWLPKKNWLNNRDQYNAPNEQHALFDQFKLDSIVWSLFHGSNQSSSLHPVSYKGVTYDIVNNFFWTDPALMNAVQDKPMPIIHQLRTAKCRFVTDWLNANLSLCGPDARHLVEDANLLVLNTLPDRKNAQARWQLDRWDAGWYQLRMWIKEDQSAKWGSALKNVTDQHKSLGNRLRPMVYELGCLPQERRYEEEEN